MNGMQLPAPVDLARINSAGKKYKNARAIHTPEQAEGIGAKEHTELLLRRGEPRSPKGI
jgi:hypothetical protein